MGVRLSLSHVIARKLISSVIVFRYFAVFYEKIRELEIPRHRRIDRTFRLLLRKIPKKADVAVLFVIDRLLTKI